MFFKATHSITSFEKFVYPFFDFFGIPTKKALIFNNGGVILGAEIKGEAL